MENTIKNPYLVAVSNSAGSKNTQLDKGKKILSQCPSANLIPDYVKFVEREKEGLFKKNIIWAFYNQPMNRLPIGVINVLTSRTGRGRQEITFSSSDPGKSLLKTTQVTIINGTLLAESLLVFDINQKGEIFAKVIITLELDNEATGSVLCANGRCDWSVGVQISEPIIHNESGVIPQNISDTEKAEYFDNQPRDLTCILLEPKEKAIYQVAMRSYNQILIYRIALKEIEEIENLEGPSRAIERPGKIASYYMNEEGIYFVADTIIEYVPHDEKAPRITSAKLWKYKAYEDETQSNKHYSNILVFDRQKPDHSILVISCLIKHGSDYDICIATVKHDKAANSFEILSQNSHGLNKPKDNSELQIQMISLAKISWKDGKDGIVLYEEAEKTVLFFELPDNGVLDWHCKNAVLSLQKDPNETLPDLDNQMYSRVSIWTSEEPESFYLHEKATRNTYHMKLNLQP